MSSSHQRTFEPIRLRHLARGEPAFTEALPTGFSNLLEVTRWNYEQGATQCGRSLKILGKIASDFLHSGPQALEAAIAHDWSSAHGFTVPLSPDDPFAYVLGHTTRPKQPAEYTNKETKAWERFMNGLDPYANNVITRETAIAGIGSLSAGLNYKVGGVSKYASPEEDHQVFERAKCILRGTPFVIADLLLPDITDDEARRIFSTQPKEYSRIASAFIATAQGPLFPIE